MTNERNNPQPPNPPQPPPQEPKPTEAEVIASLLGMPAALLTDMEPKTLQLLLAIKASEGKSNNLSGEQLAAMVSNAVAEAVRVMREPTPEEKAKQDEEQKRIMQARINAAAQGKQVADMIRQEQEQCQHVKPNGDHTWRGQTHSDGWAEVKCIRCLTRFRVRPTPTMMQQGLNLDQIRGLTIEHLKAWSRNSKRIDEHVEATKRQTATIAPFAEVEEEAIKGL